MRKQTAVEFAILERTTSNGLLQRPSPEPGQKLRPKERRRRPLVVLVYIEVIPGFRLLALQRDGQDVLLQWRQSSSHRLLLTVNTGRRRLLLTVSGAAS